MDEAELLTSGIITADESAIMSILYIYMHWEGGEMEEGS